MIQSLGEVLRAAEETRKMAYIHSSVNEKLQTMMHQTDKQENLEDAHIEEIFQTLSVVDANLDVMLKGKLKIIKR